tara:strand:+ start:190 stop:342 length:153 start_codon:yes stop_codon:yes gene_type:complete
MSLSSQTPSPTNEYELFLYVFSEHFSDSDVQLIRQLNSIVAQRIDLMRGD